MQQADVPGAPQVFRAPSMGTHSARSGPDCIGGFHEDDRRIGCESHRSPSCCSRRLRDRRRRCEVGRAVADLADQPSSRSRVPPRVSPGVPVERRRGPSGRTYSALDGLSILNGFAGVDPATGVEAFARVPYPLAGDLAVDDLLLSDIAPMAVLEEQAYDFSCGELRTRFHFDSGRVRASVEVTTFCSRTLPSLVLQEVVLRVDGACDVRMRCGVDHIGVLGTFADRRTGARTGERYRARFAGRATAPSRSVGWRTAPSGSGPSSPRRR